MNESIDPRVNIQHHIRAGQVYADVRTDDELQLVYLDERHVLLKDADEKHARLTTRKDFETEVGAGRYTITGNVEVKADTLYTAIDFTRVDGVGQGTARNLQREGFSTAPDIKRASDDELLAVRGVGAGNLERIREYAKNVDGQTRIQ